MSYTVKEIYYTLQGEGHHTGRPAVFLRFSGCNFWSGREQDRARALCTFCDTDFVGTDGLRGGRYEEAEELADAVAQAWEPGGEPPPMVVCTGGEPLLQLDEELIEALHRRRFFVAVETNGSRTPPPGVDWLCLSPKAGSLPIIHHADELKLVYPQAGAEPERFGHYHATHYFLQPMDGPMLLEHTRAAVAYCLSHPQWRLSLQTHKLLGMR